MKNHEYLYTHLLNEFHPHLPYHYLLILILIPIITTITKILIILIILIFNLCFDYLVNY